jgi:hypothetical protein
MIHLAVYQSHGAGAGAGATEPQGAAAIAGHRAGHRSIRPAGRLGFPGGKRVGVLPSKMSKIKGLTIQNEGFYHPKWFYQNFRFLDVFHDLTTKHLGLIHQKVRFFERSKPQNQEIQQEYG